MRGVKSAKYMNPFHTAQELVIFSNQVHWIEGWLLLAVIILSFLQARNYIQSNIIKYLWPLIILLAGSILVPYLLLHHGLENFGRSWYYIWNDPQQRQHFIMGILLMISGLVELLYAAEKIKERFWKFVWPTVLVVIGVLFMIHTQHGTSNAVHESVIFHRYLGTALILSGVFKALELVWVRLYPVLKYIWMIFLLITSIMLIIYREPVGAYMMDHSLCNQQGCSINTDMQHQ